MAQEPRWYREQSLKHQLKHVLANPYADASTVAAARKAIDLKLEQQDRHYAAQQSDFANNYLKKLEG